jgi:hypothetical protein
MTEFSGFWTTEPSTPAGDQVSGYTQAHWSTALAILAACSGKIGIAPGYRSNLAPSVGGANLVNIAAGGAVVDGKWHDSDATVGVTIPSAVGGGNTRIDRIVVRVGWAGFTARVTRIAGVDASSPTAPAITTTSGTTYDIKICQVTVDTSGACTISLDEREWAMVPVDDSTIENASGTLQVPVAGIDTLQLAPGAVETDKLDDDAVDDSKAGDRVPQFYRRQGGSSSNWHSAGTTTYIPTAVRMQAGSFVVTDGSGTQINFPVAFNEPPLVFFQLATGGAATALIQGVTATHVIVGTYDPAGVSVNNITVTWLAIGEE